MKHVILVLLFCAFTPVAWATVFRVSLQGIDDTARSGTSEAAAWRTLAYASGRVPAGRHTIQLGAGDFVETVNALPRNGITIAGNGRSGPGRTRVMAATTWPLPNTACASAATEYLISIPSGGNDITVRDLELASDPTHRINGAIYATGFQRITIHDVTARDFRWAGVFANVGGGLQVHHCRFENANTDYCNEWSGNLRTRFISDSEIHDNVFISRVSSGYGYKGGGHENVRFYNNYFDVKGEFDFESAHEIEYGVEIFGNYFDRCISIPRVGQNPNPATNGFSYTFWIHDNVMTDSYTIEGPRNHLRLSHNFISIEKTGGRVYSQHGGDNLGPVWIHNNIIENVDRSFVWKNQGTAADIQVFNNTVYCADAGDRASSIFDTGAAAGITNWAFRNNLIIAPASQPRALYPPASAAKVTATHNLCLNITGLPPGNFSGNDPGFTATGALPWPYYTPASVASYVVDRGLDVGLPFTGAAPDIGAYDFGQPQRWPVTRVPNATTTTDLVNRGAVWRFLDNGTAPAATWTAPSFNDTAWGSGPAMLGYGDANGVLPATFNAWGTNAAQRHITTYYRHAFAAPAQGFTSLTLGVQRDDGVVVYLNGTEVFRDNLPGGPILPATLATTSISGSGESDFLTTSLSPALLQPGVNVLAAEIHQATADSSDIAFDLTLAGESPGPPLPARGLIFTPSQDQVFANPGNVPVIAHADDPDGRPAKLEIYLDAGKVAELATWPARFSLPALTAGTYVLRAAATDSVTGVVTFSIPVRFHIAPRPQVLIDPAATWRVLDNGSDQGTAWQSPAFNDAAWRSGPASFGFGDPATTAINIGPSPNRYVTTYFRHRFTIGNPAAFAGLTFDLLRDDGAVVYLNGIEQFRSNLPAGPIDYSTPATTNISGSNETAYVTATANGSALVAGDNVIAVELHQFTTPAAPTSDAIFALRLQANLPAPAFIPGLTPHLGPGGLHLSWPLAAWDYTLETSTTLEPANSWLPVGTMAIGGNPFHTLVMPMTAPRLFLRLRHQLP
jgi:hypothetical protein